MAKSNAQQSQVQVSTTHPLSTGGILQRQCETCGKHTIAGESCADCERAEGTVQRSVERAGQGGGSEGTKPSAGLQHDFSGVPIRRKAAAGVQTKLTVGAVGDKYEQEADRVAEQVMRMPDPDEEKAVSEPASLSIQRLPLANNTSVHRQAEDVSPEEKEEKESPDLQRQDTTKDFAASEEDLVQAKESVGETSQITADIEERLATRRGKGEPLTETTRSFMETQFGQNFEQVRIHSDSEAARLSKTLRAQAFTHRQDVYFGSGRYNPESTSGRRLLAHELTHVVQQTATKQRKPSSAPDLQKNDDETGTRLLQSKQALTTAITANDFPGVVGAIRGHTVSDLRALKNAVHQDLNIRLDRWLVHRVNNVGYLRTMGRWLGLISPSVSAFNTVSGGLGNRANTSTATPETALRILWPAMSLLERLEAYSETFREIETAQLDVIRASSSQERAAARREPTRLKAIYGRMNPEEEYKARLLIDPNGGYTATSQLISRASSWTGDTEDPVFDAILALSPSERRLIWEKHSNALSGLVWAGKLSLIRLMATGRTTQAAQANPQSAETKSTEAQALIARLRLATEGRIDDTKGIQTVVNRTASLLKERQALDTALRSSGLSAARRVQIEQRLSELGDLDALISLNPPTAQDRSKSIMWRLSEAASSPDQFAQWAQTASGLGSVGTSPPTSGTTTSPTANSSPSSTTPSVSTGARQRFLIAKQRILLSSGTFSVDNEAIESAIVGLRAPTITANETLSSRQREQRQTRANNQLRQHLLRDPEVRTVLTRLSRQGPAGGIYVSTIERLASADRFTELLNDFGDAVNRADYGEVFRLTLVFARRPEWRTRFEATGREFASAYSRIQGKQREIVQTILRTQQVPINDVLTYTGNVDTLKRVLGQLNEQQRGRLRLGYWLSREQPAASSLTDDAKRALTEFREFETRVQQSQTLIGISQTGVQDVLDAALGSAPTESEMRSGAGRLRAAGLLYHRQRERLNLDVGLSATFTETDETMLAAAREYAALWERVRNQGRLSTVDFAALISLHSRFEKRSQEFTAASQTVSEVASMIASTAAAIIVVAATGGTATPAVLAAAAAAGASTRVMTREVFGGDYYNPTSEAGARDALLGALDGALAVLGSSLAARGTELLGLGGSSLTRGAARLSGEAVEQATQSLSQRVAAGAVEASIDGVFSGSISEAVMTMTDPQAWRRGIWQGLAKVGQAAIIGGLTGLGSGVVIGGALPIAGTGINRTYQGLLGRSLERTLAQTSSDAVETLQAARRAARRGNTAEAQRLFGELENYLNAAQASALRRELGLDGRLVRRPAGTAEPTTVREAELLEESRALGGNSLTQEHLDAELSIVRRSRTQPSSLEGYIDEVELGNGHKWARREDGTWCRFSTPSLCGTRIERPPLLLGTTPINLPSLPTVGADELTDAPVGAPILEISFNRHAANFYDNAPLPNSQLVLQFPDGTRVWRDSPGSPIRHETTLAPRPGRSHLERGHYTSSQHGNLSPGPRYERAHTLGQTTGAESPYALFYAPRYVNQNLQNHGIEGYMRALVDNQLPNTSYRLVTETAAHPMTRRLSQIHYRVEVIVGGQPHPFFEYTIRVQGTVQNPRITADPISFAQNPVSQAHQQRVTIPDILTQNVNHTVP